jgi:hypothetical protein
LGWVCLFLFCFDFFETGSCYCTPRQVSNLFCSCISILSTVITGVHHHTQAWFQFKLNENWFLAQDIVCLAVSSVDIWEVRSWLAPSGWRCHRVLLYVCQPLSSHSTSCWGVQIAN